MLLGHHDKAVWLDQYRHTRINGNLFLTFSRSASFISVSSIYIVGLVMILLILIVVRVAANTYRDILTRALIIIVSVIEYYLLEI